VAWSPELAVHHEELDRQHAELFRLLDAAAATFEAGSTPELVRAVAAFTEAMLAHTAWEEALMEESLFPDRGRHRVAHEVFLTDLQQLAAELKATGPTPQVGEWVRIRVPEWLRFHVAVNDAKLGAHLARRPAGARGARRGDTRRTSS
jgi:hemerythrin